MPIDAIQQIATSAARIAPGVEGRVAPMAQAQTAEAFKHAADQASATLREAPESSASTPDPDGGGLGGGFARQGGSRQGGGESAPPRAHEDGLGDRIDLAA